MWGADTISHHVLEGMWLYVITVSAAPCLKRIMACYCKADKISGVGFFFSIYLLILFLIFGSVHLQKMSQE